MESPSQPGVFLSLPCGLLSPFGGRASQCGFAGKGFPGRSGQGLPGKALQCPVWPLCGVVILAVCFLASRGGEALSQGSSLSLSSLPKEVLGGNTDSFVWNGLWCPGICILVMVRLSRWCRIAGLPYTPSQGTLTNDSVKEARHGCFLHLTDAGMVTKRGEIISKKPGISTQASFCSSRSDSVFSEQLMSTLNESPASHPCLYPWGSQPCVLLRGPRGIPGTDEVSEHPGAGPAGLYIQVLQVSPLCSQG